MWSKNQLKLQEIKLPADLNSTKQYNIWSNRDLSVSLKFLATLKLGSHKWGRRNKNTTKNIYQII